MLQTVQDDVIMELKITPSGQTIVKPTALGPVANTDTKLLIYGLFQKGLVLAQDDVPHRFAFVIHLNVYADAHCPPLCPESLDYYRPPLYGFTR